ncbi:unnamed protein product [Brugia pahangi]|uniref:Ovule protein n=1 Tax=Brugia pahangi TaxID=6280 RepID=A0A0N4TDQ0_BRUPA|nr:unnamed protein product [Brugia pahangi]
MAKFTLRQAQQHSLNNHQSDFTNDQHFDVHITSSQPQLCSKIEMSFLYLLVISYKKF